MFFPKVSSLLRPCSWWLFRFGLRGIEAWLGTARSGSYLGDPLQNRCEQNPPKPRWWYVVFCWSRWYLTFWTFMFLWDSARIAVSFKITRYPNFWMVKPLHIRHSKRCLGDFAIISCAIFFFKNGIFATFSFDTSESQITKAKVDSYQSYGRYLASEIWRKKTPWKLETKNKYRPELSG